MMFMALAGTSCQDWLDMPSQSKYDSESTFGDVEKTELAVIGCYPNSFNREMYYQLGMGTDECISTEGETNSKNQSGNYVYTTSNAPTGVYNAMYSSIEYANNCIKNLETMKGSSDSEQKKINQLLGESLAVRAMDYWNLIRFFGDVPFATVPVVDQGTFVSSRVSRDVIYDQIIADLQRATDLLAWKSEGQVSTTERFTKNAAYGILARVALYAAGYSLRWDLNTYDASTVQLAQRSDANRVKELYKIAADRRYLTDAERMADASYRRFFEDVGRADGVRLMRGGELWFDAVMARGYLELLSINGDRTYVNAIIATLRMAWDQRYSRNAHGLFGKFYDQRGKDRPHTLLNQAAMIEMMARLSVCDKASHDGDVAE